MSRKSIMFLFFAGQIIIGIVCFLNPIPFEYILRLFGLFLIALSPMWLVMFRLERVVKQKDEK